MLKQLLEQIRFNLIDRKISPIGLGLFRIVYCLVLLLEIFEIFQFRHLIFDPIPFIKMAEFSFGWLLLVWMLVILTLMVGWQSRIMAWANYVFSVLILGGFTLFEYHIDYIFISINLLLPFMPISRALSLDRWRRAIHGVQEVPVIFYHIVVWVGLGMVYFDSVFWKINMEIWKEGLGFWLPASLPHIIIANYQTFLNQAWLAKSLGYLTFAFESLFLFLFIFPRLRLTLCIIGIGLHLGILLVFPIPWFALGVLGLYILMLPYSYYEKLAAFFRHKALQRESSFKLKPILYWMGFTLAMQGVLIVMFVPWGEKSSSTLQQTVGNWLPLGTKLAGISPHPVFVDAHFKHYASLLQIRYINQDGYEQVLPITLLDGRPGKYLRGRIWVHWTWRISGPGIAKTQRNEGFSRFTAFWAKQNGIDLQSARFSIYASAVQIPSAWQKDFLKNSLERTWHKIGDLIWMDQQAILKLDESNF